MSRRITDADVNAEMIRRGFMRPAGGGFVGEDMKFWATPTPVLDPASRAAVRDKIRADLQAAVGRREGRNMSKARNDTRGRVEDVIAAIFAAHSRVAGRYTSKPQAAERLKDHVNEILTSRGFDTRTAGTIRRHIPESILTRK